MKDLITQEYKFIMTSMSFSDFHKGGAGQYKFQIKFETSGYTSYFSKNLNSIRFDVDVVMVSTVNEQHVGFTLNATTRVIIKLKDDIKKETIEDLINKRSEENIKRINKTLRPIILKEIEYIFKKTFYKDVELSGLA